MKTRVLLVEDDKVDQMAFQRTLEKHGDRYEPTVAGSVGEAQKLLSGRAFDIVLVDFSLGDGNGFEVFNSIRNVPYVVITGENSADVAVEAMKSGAADYLVKDLNRSYLTLLPTVIDRAIKDHRIEARLRMLSEAMLNITDSVYITDANSEIIYVNASFLKTYRYQEKDVIGQQARPLLEGKSGKLMNAYGDVRQLRSDGSVFMVALSSSTVTDDEGRECYRITIAHDISERKDMEEALVQAIDKYAKLLSRVEDKNSELARDYEGLKSAYEKLIRTTAK